jgi:alpha-beta hydrolase superfamily lysophospholipase
MLFPAPPGSEAILRHTAEDAHLVSAGALQPACASFFLPARAPARGAVLMLHGWTAGPWQFADLAALLSQRGFHCYAARLPGHGAAAHDGSEDSSLLPRSAQASLFESCGTEAFAELQHLAAEHGLPLCLVGFSAGGAMGLDLMQRFPDKVARAVLIAPMLRLKPRLPRAMFQALRWIPGSGFIADRIRMSWGPMPDPGPDGWRRPGHWHFRFGHLYALMLYTGQVHRRATRLAVPTQFIVSGADDKVDEEAIFAFKRQAPDKHHVWCFPAADRVPHAMLTAGENPDAKSRAFVGELVHDFLSRGAGRDLL